SQSQLNLYLPYSLVPARSMAMLVRADDPASMAAPVRETLRNFAPGLPTFLFRTLEEVRYFTTWEQRFLSRVFLTSAVAALLLASLGTYGLVSYRSSRRTREIGVRVALGASDRDVFGMLLREGSALAAMGIAIGVPASYAVSRMLEGLLYRVPSVNVALYMTASLLLAAAVLLAGYLPARRAARMPPMAALRQE
ncbi:MAG: FtsX-like permease family protein, partial [Vicinamibacteria bacterium]